MAEAQIIDVTEQSERVGNATEHGPESCHEKWRWHVVEFNEHYDLVKVSLVVFDDRESCESFKTGRQHAAMLLSPNSLESGLFHAKRLPVYGESRSDRKRRQLRHSRRFGEWLVSHCRDEDVGELVILIDGVANVDTVSIDDVEAIAIPGGYDLTPIKPTREELAWFANEAPYEDVDDPWAFAFYLNYRMPLSEFNDLVHHLSLSWMAEQGVQQHRCASVMEGIVWPDSPGVYFAYCEGKIKIGKANNVAKRLKEVQTGSPSKIALLAVRPGGLVEEAEEHRRWRALRSVGEWFEFRTELREYVERLRSAA